MKKLPPEEFLGYCQVIKQSQLATEDEKSHGIDFIDPHGWYVYQVSREVLFKLWSIIQDNLSEDSYLSVIPNQCDHVTKLIRIIRDNFGEIFLKEHQEELRKSIEKLWHLIQTKQTKEKLVVEGRQGNRYKKEDDALDDGIMWLFEVIQCVLNLSMEFFPEEFLRNNQNIRQSQQTLGTDQSCDIDAVDPEKRSFYQISKDVLLKIWNIIEDNFSEANDPTVIFCQCNHMEKLVKLTLKQSSECYKRDVDDMSNGRYVFKKIMETIPLLADAHEDYVVIQENLQKVFPKHEKKIRAAIVEYWDFIQTRQTKIKLASDITDVGNYIDWVSDITMMMLPTEEFQGCCQNIQRSRQAIRNIQPKIQNVNKRKNEVLSKLQTLEIKCQKAIDQFQLNKQKRKCESSGDNGTSEKLPHESSSNGGTSEKRQRE